MSNLDKEKKYMIYFVQIKEQNEVVDIAPAIANIPYPLFIQNEIFPF